MTKSSFFITVPLFVAFLIIITPQAEAATYYNYSKQDSLAELRQQIRELQLRLEELQRYPVSTSYYPNTSSGDYSRYLSVSTGVAKERDRSVVELEGEVDLKQRGDAMVWFEYGTSHSLESSSYAEEIDGSSRSSQTFRISVNVRPGRTYYYRAVAEDARGEVVEGKIRSFTPSGYSSSNSNYDYDDNYYYDNNDYPYNNHSYDNDYYYDRDAYSDTNQYRLNINNGRYDEGDTVTVDYQLPRNERGYDNWIGLFERGKSNSNYDFRQYASDDSGSLDFFLDRPGRYEFRMFINGNPVAMTSDFEVRN